MFQEDYNEIPYIFHLEQLLQFYQLVLLSIYTGRYTYMDIDTSTNGGINL